jgi:hypothetical protein
MAASKRVRLGVEVLEDRDLTTTGLTAGLYQGVLGIGDARPLTSVVVREIGSRFTVDGLRNSFSVSQVHSISIYTPAGSDTIYITGATSWGQRRITVPINVYDGLGNDTFKGATGQILLADTQLTGGVTMHYASAQLWRSLGGAAGPLGNPTGDEQPAGDGVGRITWFQNGAIYWSSTNGAHETHGRIFDKWLEMGGMNSPLGAPVSNERDSVDGLGRISYFKGGAIYWTVDTGAHATYGAIYRTWKSLGAERSALGEPITSEEEADNGRVSYFQGGTIVFDWNNGSQVSYNGGDPWGNFNDFVDSLSDPTLATDVRAWTLDDGELSRDDVLNLLAVEESLGTVSAGQLSDLQAVAANYQLEHMPYDVADLLAKVVGDNLANQTFQGGPLGDLYAGSSAEQLTALKMKWFFGGDPPAADVLPPTIGGGTSPVAQTSYAYAQGSLFGPTGQPQYTDVNQGAVGDCYFLAALADVAYQDPFAIKSSIIDNGDGTYTIRFNKAASGQSPDWDYITVNRMLPAYYRTDAYGNPSGPPYFAYNGWYNGAVLTDTTNALWVGLYEKAYAQLAEEGWSRGPGQNQNAYSAIGGGDAAVAITQIGGVATQEESITGADVASVLTQGVAAGQWAVLSTPVPEPDPNIAEGHSYTVLGYDPGTATVTVYNPWGFSQQVSLNVLQQDFDSLAFSA